MTRLDEPPVAVRDATPLVAGMRVLRERWPIVLASVVVSMTVVLAFSLTSTKLYDATARLLFRPSDLTTLIDPTTASDNGDRQRDQGTSLLLVKSTAVAQRVKDALRLPDSTDDLLGKITAEAEPDADIINVTAEDEDPARAARLANEFARQFVAYRADADRARIAQGEELLKQQLAELPLDATAERAELRQALQKVIALRAVTTGDAEVVDSAEVPTAAASPRPKRDAVLGLLLGLAVGIGVAFLVDLFDRRLKTVEDIESAFGMSALTTVPQRSRDPTNARERQAAIEPFRILRNGLDFLAVGSEIRVVLVTSAMPGEGKSTVASGLARATALAGHRVVLVEADLRRPTMREQFHLDDDPRGLTTALIGGAPARSLQRRALPGLQTLTVLPSGPLPPNSAELLRSAEMEVVLRELSEEADLVILDAPPLLPVADARVLLDHPQVDACLLVARAFRTTRDDVRRAAGILERHRVRSVGLVVNGARDRGADYGYYEPVETPRPAVPTG